MNELIGGELEKPPEKTNTFSEDKPPSNCISLDRDNRIPDNLLFRNIFGRGQLLNRGLSLLDVYISLDNK
jgi:hypothetical protein